MLDRRLFLCLTPALFLPSRLALGEETIIELTDETFEQTIITPAASVVAFYDGENIDTEDLWISPDKRIRYELLPSLAEANKYARPGGLPIIFAAYDLAQRGEIPQTIGIEGLTIAFFNPGFNSPNKTYNLMPPMIDNARGHLEYQKELKRRVNLLKE